MSNQLGKPHDPNTSFGLTLKNIKHAEFASQETHCFEATIYLHGKPAIKVENDGRGGADNHYGRKGQSAEDFRESRDAVGKAAMKYVEANDPDHFSWMMKDAEDLPEEGKVNYKNHLIQMRALEFAVADILSRILVEKSIKRQIKSKIHMVEKRTKDLYQIKVKPSNEAIEWAKVKYGEKHIILNDLPFEEQFAHWTRA
jgi:hypothetical protein